MGGGTLGLWPGYAKLEQARASTTVQLLGMAWASQVVGGSAGVCADVGGEKAPESSTCVSSVCRACRRLLTKRMLQMIHKVCTEGGKSE